MQQQTYTTIISIDPGYERLGICVLKKDFITKKITITHSECFKTSKDLDFQDRLLNIGNHLEMIIKKYKPSKMAVESLFMSTNQKTALKVSEVKGILIYVSKNLGLKIFEYTPLQIKSAITGNGRSDKTAVQKMLYILIPELKNIEKKIDDEYDAIACGLTHFALERGM
jgi:crossover junction endodeoxyribonuclease RuvC